MANVPSLPVRGEGAVASQRGWGTMAEEIARSLRRCMTPQEVKLWVNLRGLKAEGFHFRRQCPIGGYIVDFAEKSHGLVIEVDGSQHGMGGHVERDCLRDAELARRGFKVLRFWNIDIDQTLDGTMDCILWELSPPPHPRRSGGPSPTGEG